MSRYLLGAEQNDARISEKASRTPTLLCEFSGVPAQVCSLYNNSIKEWSYLL